MKRFDFFDEYNEEEALKADLSFVRDLINIVKRKYDLNTELLARKIHVSFKSIDRWSRREMMPSSQALLALMRLSGLVGNPRDPRDPGDHFIIYCR